MKEIFIPKHKLEQLYVYERKSIGEIAQIFNCSKSAIRNKLKKYKIPIRPSNYKRDSFGRFKKGNIPWNKGKKLDKLVGKKRAELIKKKYSDKITKKIDLTMNENLAYIIGVVLGDGYITYTGNGNYIVGLDASEKKFVESFVYALKKLGLRPYIWIKELNKKNKKWRDQYCVRVYSKQLYLYIKNLDYNKLYNELINDEKFIYAFLRGFYESEGSIRVRHKNTVEIWFTNTNDGLIKLLKRLLNILQIKSYIISEKRNKINYKDCYKIYIGGSSKEKIEFITTVNPCIKVII